MSLIISIRAHHAFEIANFCGVSVLNQGKTLLYRSMPLVLQCVSLTAQNMRADENTVMCTECKEGSLNWYMSSFIRNRGLDCHGLYGTLISHFFKLLNSLNTVWCYCIVTPIPENFVSIRRQLTQSYHFVMSLTTAGLTHWGQDRTTC